MGLRPRRIMIRVFVSPFVDGDGVGERKAIHEWQTNNRMGLRPRRIMIRVFVSPFVDGDGVGERKA
ncbi:MAG: hypothetical protein ACUVWW_11970, partial [Anaerolineae bacterium]